MMYFIHKFVGWLLSPFGFFFGGMLVAAVCAKFGRRRMALIVAIASIGLLWFFSTAFATRLIGERLEREFRAKDGCCCDIGDVGQIDLICVLGGGVGWHEKCRAPEMGISADRVWQGARLWRVLIDHANEGPEGVKIALSGGDVIASTVPVLKDFGIPEDVFVYFEEARTTDDEARLIASTGVRRVALVTSAWHMLRSKLLFERAGLEVVPVAADFEMTAVAERPFAIAEFVPTPDDLLRNSLALKEWVAFAIYKVLK